MPDELSVLRMGDGRPQPRVIPSTTMGDAKKKPPQSAEELLERYAAGERDFRGANLNRANLCEVKLVGATLIGASFTEADLIEADLRGADLRETMFVRTNLSEALLIGGRLSGAYFLGANLWRLQTDSLAGSELAMTALTEVDLSSCDLSGVKHGGPCYIDFATINRTAAGLSANPSNQAAIESFFRSCGLEEHAVDYFRSRVGKRIKYHSVFISYSSKDKDFARRLYDALQARGIRCWLDEHQILPGDRIRDAIDRGIKLWDKVVLCCSESSLESWWVEEEIERALKKEARIRKNEERRVGAIVPLTIDDYVHDGWDHAMRATIRSRSVADFRDWKNHDSFEAALEVLVKALRADAGGREEPPEPRL